MTREWIRTCAQPEIEQYGIPGRRQYVDGTMIREVRDPLGYIEQAGRRWRYHRYGVPFVGGYADTKEDAKNQLLTLIESDDEQRQPDRAGDEAAPVDQDGPEPETMDLWASSLHP